MRPRHLLLLCTSILSIACLAWAADIDWSEDATRDYFNRQLKYRWAKSLGDHDDKPMAQLRIADIDQRQILRIGVRGREFMIIGKPGVVVRFHSRESIDATARPQLRIGKHIYTATRDTVLDPTTSKPQGHLPQLHTGGTILLAFDDAPDALAGELILTSDQQFGNEEISIYRPTPSFVRTSVPSWLQGPNRILWSVDGNVMQGQSNVRIDDGIATSSLFAPRRTWMSKLLAIPPMESGCLTVYMKFHKDFEPGNGGKLPGFANTGLHRINNQFAENIAGQSFANSGWGGRKPDGVHWSARTGFGDWTNKNVEIHSYFYALAPFQGSGVIDPIGRSMPKGKWSAYVTCLRLNTPGKSNGSLFYQLAGHPPSYQRNDIYWRRNGAPQSLIREIWLDFYCGGSSCNSNAAGTISFARAEISTGLPNMIAVEKHIALLNQRASD